MKSVCVNICKWKLLTKISNNSIEINSLLHRNGDVADG